MLFLIVWVIYFDSTRKANRTSNVKDLFPCCATFTSILAQICHDFTSLTKETPTHGVALTIYQISHNFSHFSTISHNITQYLTISHNFQQYHTVSHNFPQFRHSHLSICPQQRLALLASTVERLRSEIQVLNKTSNVKPAPAVQAVQVTTLYLPFS